MKTKYSSKLIARSENIIIRPMTTSEGTNYVMKLGLNQQERMAAIKRSKEILKGREDDCQDYYFTILIDGKNEGAIDGA